MEKVDLIYKLNGNFEEGIDVFELSPILLSLGQLISESQKTIYPNSQKLAVNVRPFKENSFDIQLILHPISNLQQILDIIKSPQGRDIKELLQYIGLLSPYITGTTFSLIKLIKWLKGKPKSIEKTNSQQLKYFDNNGNSVEVSPKVHALFQNVNIQQTIYNGIARPFENEKVKNIECFIEGDEKSKEVIEKDIVEPCKIYSVAEIPSIEKIIEDETPLKLWVHPHRGSYEGESNSWSFRIVGSNENIKIDNIEDANFLEIIKTEKYTPKHSDRLHIEILQKQKIQGLKETFSRKIVKVIEIVKSEEQTSLFESEGKE